MSKSINNSSRLALDRGRQRQVRQRIPDVAVGAVLAHDDVRTERRGQRWSDGLDRREPRFGAGERFERDVDRGPGRGPLPHLADEAGAGKSDLPDSWNEIVITPGSA